MRALRIRAHRARGAVVRARQAGRGGAGMRLAAQLLAYRPAVSLAEGLDRLHAWYLASGATPAGLADESDEINWRAPSR